jgi:putative endonuclease
LSDGAAAETRALRHLEARGLRLIERNWRTRGGELDLILRDRDTLVIAEVRARSHAGFGGAAGSVDARKRARIVHAARAYLVAHPQYESLPVRFDVVAIDAGRIDWIPAAFEADE